MGSSVLEDLLYAKSRCSLVASTALEPMRPCAVRVVATAPRREASWQLYNEMAVGQNITAVLWEKTRSLNNFKPPLSSLSRGDLMIRNAILALLFYTSALSLAENYAPAAEINKWRVFSQEANGNVYFFDASRIDSTGDVRTVWMRIQYKTSVMAASSYQSLLEVDCSGRTERILQRTFYKDRQWGKPAMSTDTNAKAKRPIKKGSASERLAEILCNQ